MQPGWPKAPVELNTLFVGSTLRKIQVQNGGSERRPKSMQEASLPSQKPWVFSCVLIFGSQFHEAHLWSTNWVPALTGLLCSSQWTSDEQLSCWRLYLRWRIYAYKVPTHTPSRLLTWFSQLYQCPQQKRLVYQTRHQIRSQKFVSGLCHLPSVQFKQVT